MQLGSLQSENVRLREQVLNMEQMHSKTTKDLAAWQARCAQSAAKHADLNAQLNEHQQLASVPMHWDLMQMRHAKQAHPPAHWSLVLSVLMADFHATC